MKNRLALFFILLDHSGGDLKLHANRYRSVSPSFWPSGAQPGDVFECHQNGESRNVKPLSINALRARLTYVTDDEWIRVSKGAPVPVDAERLATVVFAIAECAERTGTTDKPTQFDDTVLDICVESGVDVRLWRVFDLAFHWWNDLLSWAEDPNVYAPDMMKAYAEAHRNDDEDNVIADGS